MSTDPPRRRTYELSYNFIILFIFSFISMISISFSLETIRNEKGY
nr:MAG TPA: hypothetical protein [Crassvirales sp.]